MSIQNSSSIISTIHKSRKTVLDLMNKQGYNTEENSNFSINEINSMYQNKQLDMLLEKELPGTTDKKKIYIKYYLEKTIRPQNIQDMIDDLFNMEEMLSKKDTLMIITKEEMNETITNELIHIWEQYQIYITILSLKSLQYNILDHVLVPNHRILSNEEVLVIKAKFNITNDTQFPDISRFDPVARVIGIRPGEICEITRPSKTAIQSKYYRICV